MRIRYAIALITITIAAVMLTAGVVAAKPIIKPACRYTAYRHYCLIENIKGHKLTFRTLVCHGVIYLGKHQLLTGTGCVNSR